MKKSNSRREKLLSEIAVEERRLAALHSEVVKQRVRLVALRDELNVLAPEQTDVPLPLSMTRSETAPITNAEKVALFRFLFRGRVDVFPRWWENPKTGRSGYSPVCANEWDSDLCEKKKRVTAGRKSRLTCGDCSNQAFLPVTDAEIEKQSGDIVAVCHRGEERQNIPILDLPLPSPKPRGVEWIEAYRHWTRGR